MKNTLIQNLNFILLKDYTDLKDGEGISDQGEKFYFKDKDAEGHEYLEKCYELLQQIENVWAKSPQHNIFVLDNNNGISENSHEIHLARQFNGKYMMQKYIGIIKNGATTIFIKSRFDNNRYDFTNYLLEKALDIQAHIFPDMSPDSSSDSALEKLLFIIFLRQMNIAYKKGLYRQYRTFQKNDSRFKGKIDTPRHIKLNPLFNGKIAYSHREYTIDNDINRLILTVYTMIKRKDPSFVHNLSMHFHDVRLCIQQMKNVIDPATRQEIPLLLSKVRKKITHSVYRDWDQVRETSILLLKHMGIHISDKTQNHSREIYGILININDLWERYLNNIFKENSYKNNEFLNNYMFQCKLPVFSGNDEARRIQTSVQPDFCFYNNEGMPTMILDAKYKLSWSELFNGQKNSPDSLREDLYQIFTYIFLFNCKSGGIICPLSESEVSIKALIKSEILPSKAAVTSPKCYENLSHKIAGTNFFVVPLIIPSGKNTYAEFKQEMESHIGSLLDQLRDIQTCFSD